MLVAPSRARPGHRPGSDRKSITRGKPLGCTNTTQHNTGTRPANTAKAGGELVYHTWSGTDNPVDAS